MFLGNLEKPGIPWQVLGIPMDSWKFLGNPGKSLNSLESLKNRRVPGAATRREATSIQVRLYTSAPTAYATVCLAKAWAGNGLSQTAALP